MQDNRERMPDERMGKFFITVSILIFIPVLFLPHMNKGTIATGAATCFSGVLMGLKILTDAKKWKEKYGEPTPEELMAIKKSHSVPILRLLALILGTVAGFVLFVLFLLGIAASLHRFFHH